MSSEEDVPIEAEALTSDHEEQGALERLKQLLPIQDLIAAGPDAPALVVRKVQESQAAKIAPKVESAMASDSFDVEEYVERIVKAHLMLARSQGAGGGLVVSAAQMSSLVGGPGTFAVATATTVLGDLVALSWVQLRMVLHIAAAYGHDISDPDRASEILALTGLELAGSQTLAPIAGAAGQRVGKRLLEKYLRGNALLAIKAMFRLVGIKFSRAALVRGLPLLNVPAGAVISDVTTRRMAAKASRFYRELPAG